MIQGISFKNNFSDMPKVSFCVPTPKVEKKHSAKLYADSFIKHAKKSTPMLMGMTAIWVAVEKFNNKNNLIDSIKKNVKGFFIPVLLASSVLLTIIENKTPKNDKRFS